MHRDIYEVKRERFDLIDKNTYILQGMFPKKYNVRASIGGKEVVSSVEVWDNTSVLEKFADLDGAMGEKVTVRVKLPEKMPEHQKLLIEAFKDSDKIEWFTIATRELLEKQKSIQYYIEEKQIDFTSRTCKIRGWAVSSKPVSLSILDENGRKITCRIQNLNRPDVVELYKEFEINENCGFYIEIEHIFGKKYVLDMKAGDDHLMYDIFLGKFRINIEKIFKYYKKGSRYFQNHGLREFARKAFTKINEKGKSGPIDYQKWLSKHSPAKAELDRQRKDSFPIMPRFSIVVPLYKTPRQYLNELVHSLEVQTYGNWELCLSDGSGMKSPLNHYLEELQNKDERIKVILSESVQKISENTNRAISIATGDYIVFADHDDVLTVDALYECARVINQNPETDIIYSDEDKMSMDGNKFFQPHFKPDFNIDLLCSVNYICHLFVVKRELQLKVGNLRESYDGAQDYDFIFRCVEQAERIHHIPKILYHWRSHENSTSENPESKLYAFDAGERAIQAHYDRMGIRAVAAKGEYLGLYRTNYILEQKPLISIIIPNKDHIDDLWRCIDSIESKSHYENYEYIIVENNSTEPETFEFYKKLQQENPKIKVVYYKGKFNFSSINNFGAEFAMGEYLWLLNNDTEIINQNCIEELVGYCMRDDVGIVGARLYYEDDTIQHAGVVIGFGGIAGHCFVQHPRGATGYFHRIICAQDYSAVTAACMMVKKSVFDAVGGMTEELEVAFNDIDFCLKVRQLGKLVVYNPYAELHHYESKSRGLEDTPEKIRRFQSEIEIFAKRWPDILRDGDPFYNPNLTLESQDFSLRRN